METSLYETDFYGWTMQQSKLLALGKLDGLDLANLIEEIEFLGKHKQQELSNRLGVLIGHLLKWQYQPQKRSRSWQVTIQLQREEINDLLADNPSLKSYLDKALLKAFRLGLALILSETPIKKSLLPDVCPYSLEQLLDCNYPDDIDVEF
ncbi:DUF29 domain-containing protein [Pseudanabaena sp. FACHB-1998]|uniref:DUF29 domain-containing protein n=1 Tax=Pseudanabaena sp. FACHB-1998 TaxID=2692858 RepID=UPI0016803153|nr:DUF29 domain-containing protein [Pseudanabaena sp. FACHB-1998]MBD2177199.1 DUF29 domain-containing protein [Pseudanabaena sp. FACHB-1998]